jgi:hypothetical protein
MFEPDEFRNEDFLPKLYIFVFWLQSCFRHDAIPPLLLALASTGTGSSIVS